MVSEVGRVGNGRSCEPWGGLSARGRPCFHPFAALQHMGVLRHSEQLMEAHLRGISLSERWHSGEVTHLTEHLTVGEGFLVQQLPSELQSVFLSKQSEQPALVSVGHAV